MRAPTEALLGIVKAAVNDVALNTVVLAVTGSPVAVLTVTDVAVSRIGARARNENAAHCRLVWLDVGAHPRRLRRASDAGGVGCSALLASVAEVTVLP